MRLEPADFDDPKLLDLLRLHVSEARANSPPGTSYALDLTGLRRPDVSLYVVRDGDALLGMGALKALDGAAGEIKSMRTHPDHLRRGVARAVMDHLLGEARARGYARVSLETGRGPSYEAAAALYLAYGFRDGPPFGDYGPSDFNRFMHLDLG